MKLVLPARPTLSAPLPVVPAAAARLKLLISKRVALCLYLKRGTGCMTLQHEFRTAVDGEEIGLHQLAD